MNILRGIYRFAYDFVIGDDWKIAAAVVTALVVGFGMLVAGVAVPAVVLATAVLLAVAFTAAMFIDVRGSG
jgi:hypothetical protein